MRFKYPVTCFGKSGYNAKIQAEGMVIILNGVGIKTDPQEIYKKTNPSGIFTSPPVIVETLRMRGVDAKMKNQASVSDITKRSKLVFLQKLPGCWDQTEKPGKRPHAVTLFPGNKPRPFTEEMEWARANNAKK